MNSKTKFGALLVIALALIFLLHNIGAQTTSVTTSTSIPTTTSVSIPATTTISSSQQPVTSNPYKIYISPYLANVHLVGSGRGSREVGNDTIGIVNGSTSQVTGSLILPSLNSPQSGSSPSGPGLLAANPSANVVYTTGPLPSGESCGPDIGPFDSYVEIYAISTFTDAVTAVAALPNSTYIPNCTSPTRLLTNGRTIFAVQDGGQVTAINTTSYQPTVIYLSQLDNIACYNNHSNCLYDSLVLDAQLTPNGNYLYIVYEYNGELVIVVINTATNAVLDAYPTGITVPSVPNAGFESGSLSFAPSGAYAYMATWVYNYTSHYNNIYFISTASPQSPVITGTIALSGAPVMVGIAPSGGYAYFTLVNTTDTLFSINTLNERILNISLNASTEIDTIDPWGGIVFTPNGADAYVPASWNGITGVGWIVINTSKNTEVARISEYSGTTTSDIFGPFGLVAVLPYNAVSTTLTTTATTSSTTTSSTTTTIISTNSTTTSSSSTSTSTSTSSSINTTTSISTTISILSTTSTTSTSSSTTATTTISTHQTASATATVVILPANYDLTVRAITINGGPACAPCVMPLTTKSYAEGAKAQISASPVNASWAFISWSGIGSGEYTGTGAIANVTMDSNITEIAYFVYKPSYTLKISSVVNGNPGCPSCTNPVAGTYTYLTNINVNESCLVNTTIT